MNVNRFVPPSNDPLEDQQNAPVGTEFPQRESITRGTGGEGEVYGALTCHYGMSAVLIGIDDFLLTMAKVGATDLALIPSVAPKIRVADTWRTLDLPPLTFVEVREYADQLMALAPEAKVLKGTREFNHERHGLVRVDLCNYPDTLAVLLIRLGTRP